LRLLPLGKELRKGVPIEVIGIIAELTGLEPFQKYVRAEAVLMLKLSDGLLVKGDSIRIERIFPFKRGFCFLSDSHSLFIKQEL